MTITLSLRCAILHCAILVASIDSSAEYLEILVPFESFIFAVASRTETIYSLILCVTRTVNVLAPTYPVHAVSIKGVMLIYPTIWVILSIYEIRSVVLQSKSKGDLMYSVVYLVLNPLTGSELLNHDLSLSLYFTILLGFPFVLPALIAVVCAALISVSLLRTRTTNVTRGQNRKITGTVLQLTTASFFLCSVYFITEIYFNVHGMGLFKSELYVLYFTGNISVFLNSFIKPVILFTRGASLRDYLRSTLSISKGKTWLIFPDYFVFFYNKKALR